MDPYQFAYKPGRSTDDATLTLLHNAYTHLDNTNSFVRILFVDFSSAFNTIQPHLMALKLIRLNVEPKLVLWILSFLTNRKQAVRFQTALSSERYTSTGSPQGTVLSPVLFTLYTNDCCGTECTPLIKYSDDTALQDLSNSDSMYFDQVSKFCQWCKDNYLDLNVSKTKELIVDYRVKAEPIPELVICGTKVERVTEYKYLGTVIDSKLDFTANTDLISQKCQSRIRCLQKLRNIGVNVTILQNFYRCCIESILTFSFVCWFGSLTVKNKNALNRVVNVCSKIVGVRLTGLNELYERRVLQRGRRIASDESHVLARHYELLKSGRRYRVPKLKARAKKSFVPKSILLLNE
jgi:gmma-aminobutyric acid receptor subunit gamma